MVWFEQVGWRSDVPLIWTGGCVQAESAASSVVSGECAAVQRVDGTRPSAWLEAVRKSQRRSHQGPDDTVPQNESQINVSEAQVHF